MKALRFDGKAKVEEIACPVRGDEALIRVLLAGICNTDLEITRGYAGFRGTLGHEFAGIVEECNDSRLVGKRVVGEINCGCGSCRLCLRGDPRHCARRTVLGIVARDGAMAQFTKLPAQNLVVVPDTIENEQAVFTEPLAAACQILDQVKTSPDDRVLVLGDGKLGLLIAQVLRVAGCSPIALGRHEQKLAILAKQGIETVAAENKDRLDQFANSNVASFDLVIEATGSSAGLEIATHLVRPLGTIVLKSTVHDLPSINTAPIVVNEITIVGSRCGRFAPAIALLESGSVDVRSMIDCAYPLSEGLSALDRARATGVLKVLIRPNS